MSPRELEGEPADCAKCGWIHRPSQKCPQTKWAPKLGARAEASSGEQDKLAGLNADAAIAKFRNLGARAEEALRRGDNQPQPTGKRCEACGAELYHYRNILGREWDGYPDEVQGFIPPEEHVKICSRPKPMAPEDIKPPRRVYDPGAD